jgi:hypothetical protein
MDESGMVRLDGRPNELATVRAFGHEFREILPGLADELATLEKEGAIYGDFWSDDAQSFQFCRIRLLPGEIVEYVEAHIAHQEFQEALDKGANFEEALQAISNREIAHRVESYDNFGKSKTKDGHEIDIRGCFASFLTKPLELVVIGARHDRRETLPVATGEGRLHLAIQVLTNFAHAVKAMTARKHGRPNFEISTEYDVQDLLFAVLRSAFEDAKREEWTPSLAGSAKRIDIVISGIRTVIEVKFVRDSNHALRVADELRIDFESYHSHPACGTLLVLVYDPKGLISDGRALELDLSGLRKKGTHEFDVKVMVRP